VKGYLLIPSIIILSCLASAQGTALPPGRAIPPGYAEADRQARELEKGDSPQVNPVQRPNFLQMQRNAKELADLARSVPPDIDVIAKGLLPKDLVNRLKKIEKLAKELRSQVSR